MANLALCVDVDRDAPFPSKGRIHAVPDFLQSHQQESSELLDDPIASMLTEGTTQGLTLVLDLAEELNIPLNLFIEGRLADHLPSIDGVLSKRLSNHAHDWDWGVHGYDHEDLPGKETGIPLSRNQQFDIIEKAYNSVRSLVGCDPVGFRAPYTRLGFETLSVVEELRFQYDSSIYIDSTKAPQPYRISKNLWEVPIVKIPQESRSGYLYLYLWSLFEGRRTLIEHIQAVKTLRDPKGGSTDGLITLNFHPWHLAYSLKESRYLSKEEFQNNVHLLRNYLLGIDSIDEIQHSFVKISQSLP